MTTPCPKCQADVPSGNFALHEVRCPGKPAAPAIGLATTAARRASETQGASPSPPPTCDQIAQALTWARTKPREVADALHLRLQQYKGKDYFPTERQGRCVVTKEGTAVVDEAIAFVMSLEPMQGVGSSSERGLAFAGEDHIADVGQTGAASHSSSDGTTSVARVRRYGNISTFGECLWYGSELADSKTIVLDLIVDDGVPTRGHRKGVYNSAYDTVGVAYGPHVTFGKMAAMEFARCWDENPMFIRARMQSGPLKISAAITAKAKATAGTQWALGECFLCNEPIKGGRVVEIPKLGGKLHADCFKCSVCFAHLAGGKFEVHERVPFCTGCYLEMLGDKCTACTEVIAGGKVKCALGVFHVECVICATCNTHIGKAPFSTLKGAIACQQCASVRGKASPGRTSSAPIGSGRASPPARSSLTSVGSAIASGASPGPKAGAAPKARSKAASAKAKPRVSAGMAKHTVDGLCMDYASLE